MARSIKQKVVYPSAYNVMALCLVDLHSEDPKKLNEAFKLTQKALKKKPDCHYFLDTQGTVLMTQKKFSDAVVVFEKALKVKPDDATILAHVEKARSLVTSEKTAK